MRSQGYPAAGGTGKLPDVPHGPAPGAPKKHACEIADRCVYAARCPHYAHCRSIEDNASNSVDDVDELASVQAQVQAKIASWKTEILQIIRPGDTVILMCSELWNEAEFEDFKARWVEALPNVKVHAVFGAEQALVYRPEQAHPTNRQDTR